VKNKPLAAIGVGIAVIVFLLWMRHAPEERDALDAGPPSASVTSAAPERTSGPVLDRAHADKMREDILRLLAEAGPFVGSTPMPTAAAWNGPLSATGRPLAPMPAAGPAADGGVDPLAAYIRDRVREDFMPLALKCYTNELETNPKLAGRARMKFKIVGDKRVGGVVDGAELDTKDSDLTNPAFVQCLTESMMSVSFGAPPDGHGSTSVEYPFEFSPDEPDAARR
jgi:hypothetical protein